MKNCSNKDCKQVNPQPIENFYIRKARSGRREGLQYRCKKCCSEASGKIQKIKRKAIPNFDRENNLISKYGISLEQYNKILTEQNNCCAICKRNESEFSKNLHVDHEHIKGRIRGLLCSECNTALGLLKDDPELLDNAKKYLLHINFNYRKVA